MGVCDPVEIFDNLSPRFHSLCVLCRCHDRDWGQASWMTGRCMQDLCRKARDANKLNVAFLAAFMLQDADKCLEILVACSRLPEAAFFARTHRPSRCSEMLQLWKNDLCKVNARAAAALADPAEYPNLFPDWDLALQLELQCTASLQDPAESAGHYASKEGCTKSLVSMVNPHRITPSVIQVFLSSSHDDVTPTELNFVMHYCVLVIDEQECCYVLTYPAPHVLHTRAASPVCLTASWQCRLTRKQSYQRRLR